MKTTINSRTMVLMLSISFGIIFAVSCKRETDVKSENISMDVDNFVDPRDGNSYKTVKIGSQVWMAENLRYLPFILDTLDFTSGSMEYYSVEGYSGNNVSEAKGTSYYKNYGVAYNWTAASKACPAGWHLPSAAEWDQLIDFCGGNVVAGAKLKSKDDGLWKVSSVVGTDDYGFSAKPAGIQPFGFVSGVATSFWNSGNPNKEDVMDLSGVTLFFDRNEILYNRTQDRNNQECISIRCIKD